MAAGGPSIAQGVLFPSAEEPRRDSLADATDKRDCLPLAPSQEDVAHISDEPTLRSCRCRHAGHRSAAQQGCPGFSSRWWCVGEIGNQNHTSPSATQEAAGRRDVERYPWTTCMTRRHDKEQLGFAVLSPRAQYRHKLLQSHLLERRPPAPSQRATRNLPFQTRFMAKGDGPPTSRLSSSGFKEGMARRRQQRRRFPV